MDELRRRLADLDRVAVPDHWAEIERRAWTPTTQAVSTPEPTTRWIGTGDQPPRRTSPVLTPVRVLAVGLVAAVSTGLLAVSLSSPSSDPARSVTAAPGASPGTSAAAASPDAVRSPAIGQRIDWDTGCVHWPAGWLRILRPGTGPATCTQVGDVEMGTVVASPADDAASGPPIVGKTPTGMTPAVKSALEVISADLLAGCYARDEAVARLSNALIEAGASGFVVRTDGPIGGPKDRIDEIMAHVDAGCVIYGGSGATGDGTPVYYVGGGSGGSISTFVPGAEPE